MSERKYSVIVSDLGNVLIPFDYSIAFKRLEKVEIGLGQKFLDRYKENYELHRSYERGEIPDDVFLTKLSEFADNKIDKDILTDVYSKIFYINEEVVSLLPLLKKKYRLVLLSNTNPIHRKYGWNHYHFIKYFEKLILSYEIGSVKPEEEIYKAVENYTGFPPEEHIFIDDVFEYAEAAKKLGWDAVHFKNYNQLVTEFSNRGILQRKT